MPIRIPTGEKIVRDARITTVRALKSLHDHMLGGEDGLVAKIKAGLRAKDATFAESEHCLAALRGGGEFGEVDPKKLYKLVESGKLKLAHFLACVKVIKTPLREHLTGAEIERLSEKVAAPEPFLITEFREGVEFDLKHVDAAMEKLLAEGVKSK